MGAAKEITNPKQKDKDCAVHVLHEEAAALRALADSIDGQFHEAVEAVHTMKNTHKGAGRLIVAGIGKSGHVARKIAATLASTGTPSYFVHPGEASHGDMGMITDYDVVLMLSNSGENAELSDLIHYTRRYDITLIAMTSNPDSTLAKHADIKLIMPNVGEVCPNGLAPTTSTTMMIAYGDALAIALLERMGLTPEQYKVFHPGGKLGQKLMTVADLMVQGSDLPIVPDTALMDMVLLELTGKNLGAVLVFNDKHEMQGIVTDGDLKRHMAPDLLQRPVMEIMTKNPKSIAQECLAAEALDIMTKTPGRYITNLIVTKSAKSNEVVGMIRLQDCLQAGIA
ncbi:MAG: KpsF/GutQ family sugar-phosphate isomerase [Alphaproteobacteria bacterium]|nr:KpsF/GutQ family sugar-phosphate isomerase [Alphaproteobacteria bacterium]